MRSVSIEHTLSENDRDARITRRPGKVTLPRWKRGSEHGGSPSNAQCVVRFAELDTDDAGLTLRIDEASRRGCAITLQSEIELASTAVAPVGASAWGMHATDFR